MSQKQRQSSKKSKPDQIEAVIRLLNAGKTQTEAAKTLGINLRTVQRWVADPEVKQRLVAAQREVKAIVASDPVVMSVTEIRAQVQEILDYRDSQRNFALEMGRVVQKATLILLNAVERLEENPDEVTIRTIPQLMRAVTDASEKVSSAWARTTGLDDLLEQINEPKAIREGSSEA
ncbi:MAG: helix-turn-helix domain-containing protein [Symplocastrum torsivum CPER-KK1]|jgi:predicted DNA-binding protein (UPF0251 family)|uniref:Helix-turn-helix domain-containing protein n=1 Tax=Symplocastrum torsivum CPER-KK1 TaxID=450513 RepID=A0A951PU96_9CYAN|nr:helix-turn-helix domain-containing protein [Symplocastrum torsivum CPER-KK1]